MKTIKINRFEDLRSKLTKNQLRFFRDKAKESMDVFVQLIEVRDKCADYELVEKVYGRYIFVLYRSIFNFNYLDNNTKIKLNYKIFLRDTPDNKNKYSRLHDIVIKLVNEIYAHTDLCSEYKKYTGIKKIMRLERGINYDGILRIVNLLATMYFNIEEIIKGSDFKFVSSEYCDGGWAYDKL